MKLVDLNPRWVGAGGDGITRDGKPVPERTGVMVSFDCPCGCDTRVSVALSNPLDGGPPYEPDVNHQWRRMGDDFDRLTLTPSIQRVIVKGVGCGWHGWVTGGEIKTC